MLALAREAGEKGGTYPCAYNAANEVAVAAFLAGRLPFLGIAEVVADALERVDGSPARDLDELVEADRAARAFADERLAGRMTWLVVSVGLLLLVFLHELGHFTVALAVGIRPRSFYVGFPPALVKVKRKGIEYGIGVIPLGGLVRIPGMHRPAPQRPRSRSWRRRVREEPALSPYVQRVRRPLEAEDFAGARAALPELRSRDRAARS